MIKVTCWLYPSEVEVFKRLVLDCGTSNGCSCGYLHTFPNSELVLIELNCNDAQSAFGMGVVIERNLLSKRKNA